MNIEFKGKLPEGEKIIVSYFTEEDTGDERLTHIISTTKSRDCYYLYKIKNGTLTKTKYQSKDPTELEKYVFRKG